MKNNSNVASDAPQSPDFSDAQALGAFILHEPEHAMSLLSAVLLKQQTRLKEHQTLGLTPALLERWLMSLYAQKNLPLSQHQALSDLAIGVLIKGSEAMNVMFLNALKPHDFRKKHGWVMSDQSRLLLESPEGIRNAWLAHPLLEVKETDWTVFLEQNNACIDTPEAQWRYKEVFKLPLYSYFSRLSDTGFEVWRAKNRELPMDKRLMGSLRLCAALEESFKHTEMISTRWQEAGSEVPESRMVLIKKFYDRSMSLWADFWEGYEKCSLEKFEKWGLASQAVLLWSDRLRIEPLQKWKKAFDESQARMPAERCLSLNNACKEALLGVDRSAPAYQKALTARELMLLKSEHFTNVRGEFKRTPPTPKEEWVASIGTYVRRSKSKHHKQECLSLLEKIELDLISERFEENAVPPPSIKKAGL